MTHDSPVYFMTHHLSQKTSENRTFFESWEKLKVELDSHTILSWHFFRCLTLQNAAKLWPKKNSSKQSLVSLCFFWLMVCCWFLLVGKSLPNSSKFPSYVVAAPRDFGPVPTKGLGFPSPFLGQSRSKRYSNNKKQEKKQLSRQETPNSVLEGVYVLDQKFDT